MTREETNQKYKLVDELVEFLDEQFANTEKCVINAANIHFQHPSGMIVKVCQYNNITIQNGLTEVDIDLDWGIEEKIKSFYDRTVKRQVEARQRKLDEAQLAILSQLFG